MQNIIVYIIVSISVAYSIFIILRRLRSVKDGSNNKNCEDGCNSCCDHCNKSNPTDQKEKEGQK